MLFAPENAIYNFLSRYLDDLIGIDLSLINTMVKVQGNILKTPFNDNSVSFVSCFHVIEHVSDDRAALAELNRILLPGGKAVICVPVKFSSMKTIEFGKPNPLLEDHYYEYGLDIGDRLIEAKFCGTAFRLSKIILTNMYSRYSLQD